MTSTRRGTAPVAVAIGLVALVLSAVGCGDDTASQPDASATAAKVAAFSCPVADASAGTAGDGPRQGDRLQIVTTVAPITSIVADIAGDAADVAGVIPEGTNSHTYEPKPSVAEQMSRADIVFVNGLKLEDPTKEIAETNLPKGSEIVELGTQTITPDEYIYDFSFPKGGGKPNPHLWTNPPMAACYATIAASAMASADPANAALFQANAAALVARIDELDRLMVEATASVPQAHRELLTYHDAYAYFAAHYGWKVIGAIQVSDFEDPTPKEVAALIDQIDREQVPAIFGSEVFPSPVLAQIAEETGTKYVDELRDDDLPGAPGQANHSYLALMKLDFVTMVVSLGGDVTDLLAFDAGAAATDHADYPQ